MKVEIEGSPAEKMLLFFFTESTEDPLERPVAGLAGRETHIPEAAWWESGWSEASSPKGQAITEWEGV